MKWKIRMRRKADGKPVTVYTEQANPAAARAFFEAEYNRHQDLLSIELAATKPEIIEAILADMALYRPRKDAEAQYGGFLRRQNKAELEKSLDARLDWTKHAKAEGLI